ncbi:MAG TPA: hypothetical protein VK846_06570, partial [Candidatus Limnocylindria bacterium]|nr:hypothetical protein [Candidatus Limnocylindria bacterium]
LTNFTSDADSDVRTLLSVGSGTNSATITNNGTYILYLPSGSNAQSNATDHFDYVVSDGFAGGMATNQVRISLADPAIGNPSANMTGIVVVGDAIQITFNGIPGHTYHVQRTTAPSGSDTIWEILGTAVADSLGGGVFVDASPPVGQAFYRTVWP